jgi:hypothetical protein
VEFFKLVLIVNQACWCCVFFMVHNYCTSADSLPWGNEYDFGTILTKRKT